MGGPIQETANQIAAAGETFGPLALAAIAVLGAAVATEFFFIVYLVKFMLGILKERNDQSDRLEALLEKKGKKK